MDAHSGEPLRPAITIDAVHGGDPYPIEITAGSDGSWEAFGPDGTWPLTATLDGYVTAEATVTFSSGVMTSGQDLFLHRAQPHAFVNGGPFKFILRPGKTASRTISIANVEGHAELTFETGEVNHDLAAAIAPAGGPRALPSGWNPNARTTQGLDGANLDLREIQFPGDILSAWFTEGVDLPWGVGYTGSVWLADAFEGGDACGFVTGCTIHEFAEDGVPSGAVVEAAWAEFFVGDMAYDPDRGWMWAVHVGGENGLYAIDLADGSVMDVLTGDPWSDISQRGVAYDAASDTSTSAAGTRA
jgi:hypothetical protein